MRGQCKHIPFHTKVNKKVKTLHIKENEIKNIKNICKKIIKAKKECKKTLFYSFYFVVAKANKNT